MSHTVSAVARLAGITVRTLHHYDEIGLLLPSGRSAAGYRLYEDSDLDRLQQVLFYRELGFGLEEIRTVMGTEGFDRVEALRTQRTLLDAQVARLRRLVDAVDAAIVMEETGVAMSNEEKFGAFADFDPAEHEAEVVERWGDTEAYAESKQRTAGYTDDDWAEVKQELADIMQRMAHVMASGASPDGPEAAAVVEEHRRHIDTRFYPCSKATHAGLADMWLADVRFRENIDSVADGLTEYLATAVKANAAS